MGSLHVMVETKSLTVLLVSTNSEKVSHSFHYHPQRTGMAPRKKSTRARVTPAQALLKRYRDPAKPGSLGGVERFAKAWKIPTKRAQNLLLWIKSSPFLRTRS